jgi:hypothetical protein
VTPNPSGTAVRLTRGLIGQIIHLRTFDSAILVELLLMADHVAPVVCHD